MLTQDDVLILTTEEYHPQLWAHHMCCKLSLLLMPSCLSDSKETHPNDDPVEAFFFLESKSEFPSTSVTAHRRFKTRKGCSVP